MFLVPKIISDARSVQIKLMKSILGYIQQLMCGFGTGNVFFPSSSCYTSNHPYKCPLSTVYSFAGDGHGCWSQYPDENVFVLQKETGVTQGNRTTTFRSNQ